MFNALQSLISSVPNFLKIPDSQKKGNPNRRHVNEDSLPLVLLGAPSGAPKIQSQDATE